MSEDRSPTTTAAADEDAVPPGRAEPSAGRNAAAHEPTTARTAIVPDSVPTLAAGGGRPPAPVRPTRYDPRPPAPRPGANKRRARLSLSRIDPWSVFVLALLVSMFLGVVLLVAVLVLYSLLDSMGVLASLDTFARDLQIISAGQSVLGLGRVMFFAAVIAAVDVVLLTVLATLSAFLYNLCASLTGGVEVALAERD